MSQSDDSPFVIDESYRLRASTLIVFVSLAMALTALVMVLVGDEKWSTMVLGALMFSWIYPVVAILAVVAAVRSDPRPQAKYEIAAALLSFCWCAVLIWQLR